MCFVHPCASVQNKSSFVRFQQDYTGTYNDIICCQTHITGHIAVYIIILIDSACSIHAFLFFFILNQRSPSEDIAWNLLVAKRLKAHWHFTLNIIKEYWGLFMKYHSTWDPLTFVANVFTASAWIGKRARAASRLASIKCCTIKCLFFLWTYILQPACLFRSSQIVWSSLLGQGRCRQPVHRYVSRGCFFF